MLTNSTMFNCCFFWEEGFYYLDMEARVHTYKRKHLIILGQKHLDMLLAS